MSGRSHGITGLPDSGATGLFSPAWGGRIRLQQKFGQIGQNAAVEAQRTETETRTMANVLLVHMLDPVGQSDKVPVQRSCHTG